MLERGIVVAASGGRADVTIAPSEQCAGCGACSEGANGMRVLEGVIDSLGVAEGDTVEVDTPAASRRRAQWLVYVLPVCALLAGYMAGYLLSAGIGANPDTAGAVVGIVAGAVAILALRFAGREASGRDRYEPRVRAIIARGSERWTGAEALLPTDVPPEEEE